MADNQLIFTIFQCPALYHFQQLLRDNHILLCRFCSSWIIHRKRRIGFPSRCVRSMEHLRSQRPQPNGDTPGVLDWRTLTRCGGCDWDLHVRNSEWSLDRFGSCFLRCHQSDEGIWNEIRDVVVFHCTLADFRSSHLWW